MLAHNIYLRVDNRLLRGVRLLGVIAICKGIAITELFIRIKERRAFVAVLDHDMNAAQTKRFCLFINSRKNIGKRFSSRELSIPSPAAIIHE